MSLVKREHRSAWPLDVVLTEDKVDKVFRDMFRGFFGEGWADLPAEVKPMKVEEFVEGDTCVIRAELPGIDPDKDVDLSIADGILHLRATREERTEEERPEGYRSEFHYGSSSAASGCPTGPPSTTSARVTRTASSRCASPHRRRSRSPRRRSPSPAADAEHGGRERDPGRRIEGPGPTNRWAPALARRGP